MALYDRSGFPRHKVCGEFLSPEMLPLLDALGVADVVMGAGPARIRRVSVHAGHRVRHDALPETAFGLSRYRFDALLLDTAKQRGARLVRGDAPDGDLPLVLATGRGMHARDAGPRDNRLFGFKAHFRGAANDAVELYFFNRCYVGVSPVEGGVTNVCGLAPRHVLAGHGFDIDTLLSNHPPLRERLGGLARLFEWLHTGPLVFGSRLKGGQGREGVYPAGDAMVFVDPFTGAGQLTAILTGMLAGEAAAEGISAAAFRDECRRRIEAASRAGSLLRRLVPNPLSGTFVPFVPVPLLYRMTRPDIAAIVQK